MNERIKEFVEQSTETFTTYFDGRGNVTETYFDKEKFAELIVRECAKIVEKEMDYHANWCDDKILKHFGMKE